MQVTNGLEKPRDFPKSGVGVYLFEVGLSKPLLVDSVFAVRTFTNQRTMLPDILVPEYRLTITTNLLRDADCVSPFRNGAVLRQLNFYFNIRLFTRGKTTHFRKAAALRHSSLKATTRFGNISKKPKNVKQVRFSGRIGADDEDPFRKGDIGRPKVPPILQNQARDDHREPILARMLHAQASQTLILCAREAQGY
jgi:hypothetical protein